MGEDLLIRAGVFDGSDAIRGQRLLVPPAYRELSSADLSQSPMPSFSSPWLCHYFITRDADDQLGIYTDVSYSDGLEHSVQFSEEGGSITFTVNREVLYEKLRRLHRIQKDADGATA